ncbi:MAG: flagellar biosynthetic protein FliR [Aestuariivirga sp.]
MTGSLTNFALLVFIVFCRVGPAVMLLPGFSTPRVPMLARLFLALVVSLALAPLVSMQNPELPGLQDHGKFVPVIGMEFVLGLAIGATGSLLIHAVRFAGDVISNCIGLGGIPGQPIDSNEPLGQIASLLALSMTLFVFASGLHLVAIDALAGTYSSLPVGKPPGMAILAKSYVSFASSVFLLALQIASPFIAFSLLSNLVVGLVGRLTPKISLYFSAVGIIAVVGIALLAVSVHSSLTLFGDRYAAWLASEFE